jgi:hypothetical protein
MCERDSDIDGASLTETPQWLRAVQRRLAPRFPLGGRLEVISPEYVGFSIFGQVVAAKHLSPSDVNKNVLEELGKRLALVPSSRDQNVRTPGIPLFKRDVHAWILACEGVAGVNSLDLLDADGNVVLVKADDGEEENKIEVPPAGLPNWLRSASQIEVIRSGSEVDRHEQ